MNGIRTISDGRSIHLKPVMARHALVLHCLQEKAKADPASTKKITITRTNRYTGQKEKYQTERTNNYARTPLVKLLDIWCRLRSYVGISGRLPDRKSHMIEMAKYCECSINKFKPALNELNRMGWVSIYDDQDCLVISSEKNVYALCGIDYCKKIDRKFIKPQKLENEKTTHYWLYVADINDNRQRQAYMVYKKVMTDVPEKLWLYTYLDKHGYDVKKAEKDPMLIASLLQSVYIESFHSKESEMHDWLCENRPDVNRGVEGMAYAWNTCAQNVSYIKKQIGRQHLAFIQKIGTVRSDDKSRNWYIHVAVKDGVSRPRGVLWNEKLQCTFQAFCDDIDPRMPFRTENPLFQVREGKAA